MKRSHGLLISAKMLLVLWASSVSIGCDEDSVSGVTSRLATDKDVVDLGRVFIGASARERFRLSAPGPIGVRYKARFEGDAFGFQIGPAAGTIAANGSVEMVAVYRPGREGPATTRVLFESDAVSTGSVAVTLRGYGREPPDCEDGNGCTADLFDLETGQCRHDVMRVACNDFNACTTNDVCVEGQCLGESSSCDDHDVCTDDLCNPGTGCVNLPTRSCDDGNPCTLDLCHPDRGCEHRVLPDGSPCDDLEQCTIADICLRGACIGVNVPDGTACDDGDPCSKAEACTEGTCLDPGYHRAAVGEIKFATDVGPLAEGASENPIIDRDGTVFVGVEGGVTAVDRCGDILWSNTTLGTPSWRSAVALPGILSVPVGSRVVDLDTKTGLALREVETALAFSRTSTRGVRIVDLALRASGAIVASLVRETPTSSTSTGTPAALLAEIDPLHVVATPFITLGAERAMRLAIDADEAVVAVLRPASGVGELGRERLVRFGLPGLWSTSWSTSPTFAIRSELGFGSNGDVLWTDGLLAVSRTGTVTSLLERSTPRSASGAPVTFGSRIMLVREDRASTGLGLVAAEDEAPSALIAIDRANATVVYRVPLAHPAPGMSPAVDQEGACLLVTEDGTLHAYSPTGTAIFERLLPFPRIPVSNIAIALSPSSVIVAVAEERVVGVQSSNPLSNSSWPRNRRDNLSTGHR